MTASQSLRLFSQYDVIGWVKCHSSDHRSSQQQCCCKCLWATPLIPSSIVALPDLSPLKRTRDKGANYFKDDYKYHQAVVDKLHIKNILESFCTITRTTAGITQLTTVCKMIQAADIS